MNVRECKIKAKEIVRTRKNHGTLLLGSIITSAISTMPIIGQICGPAVKLGMMQIIEDANHEKDPDLRLLYSKFKNQFGSAFLLFCSLLIFGIAALFIICLIAFIFIGLSVVIRTGFFRVIGALIAIVFFLIAAVILSFIDTLSFYVLFREENIDGIEALKKGWCITSKNIGILLEMIVTFLGWGILVLLTWGIALIYVTPLTNSAMLMLCEQLYDGFSKEDLEKAGNATFKETATATTTSFKQTVNSEKGEKDSNDRDSIKNNSEKTQDYNTKQSTSQENYQNKGLYCPSCGTKNDPGARFCENCGSKLE